MSSPVWEAWIEIVHTPHSAAEAAKSSPVWEAWIEIISALISSISRCKSSPVWEAWIEIAPVQSHVFTLPYSRLPYGRRGLKLHGEGGPFSKYASSPVWEAWIEIIAAEKNKLRRITSSPVWEAWIEIFYHSLWIASSASRLPYGRRGLKFINARLR